MSNQVQVLSGSYRNEILFTCGDTRIALLEWPDGSKVWSVLQEGQPRDAIKCLETMCDYMEKGEWEV